MTQDSSVKLRFEDSPQPLGSTGRAGSDGRVATAGPDETGPDKAAAEPRPLGGTGRAGSDGGAATAGPDETGPDEAAVEPGEQMNN